MELLMIAYEVFQNAIHRITQVLSNFWGLVGSAVVFAATWFSGWAGDARMTCILLVLAAIFLDLGWGMASSIKRGTFALSIGLVKTGIKMAIYLTIMLLSIMLEKALGDDFNLITRLATAVLVVAESISISAHILIIKPDTPVIKMLWKVLRSEIAKKLGIEVKDIEEFIRYGTGK